jgi:hypothetical protein
MLQNRVELAGDSKPLKLLNPDNFENRIMCMLQVLVVFLSVPII